MWGRIKLTVEDCMYIETPLDRIARKREVLSAQYREIFGKDKYTLQQYWLEVWIGEYDKTIALLQEKEDVR